MFVSNYYQDLIPITPQTEKESSQGRWWHFHRVYVFKDKNEKMYSLRLNWFERIFIHLRYCSMEQFFKSVFQDKKLTHIIPKSSSVALNEITPANFEDVIAIADDEFVEEDLVGNITIRKNFGYAFCIRFPNQDVPSVPGWTHISVCIQDDRFVVRTQLTPKDIPYNNLKEVLDHCFRGEYYQEDVFKKIPYFTLTKVDGSKMTYKNPYL